MGNCGRIFLPGRGGGMAYADGSNPSDRKVIGVRLPFPAPDGEAATTLSVVAALSHRSAARRHSIWTTRSMLVRPAECFGLPDAITTLSPDSTIPSSMSAAWTAATIASTDW